MVDSGLDRDRGIDDFPVNDLGTHVLTPASGKGVAPSIPGYPFNMTSQPVDPAAGVAQPGPQRRRLTVRRAPKYVPFMVAGALLGVIVAAILTLVSNGAEQFGSGSVFGFFAVLLMVPGVGLGAVVALVIDRRSIRRTETAVVESVAEDGTGD